VHDLHWEIMSSKLLVPLREIALLHLLIERCLTTKAISFDRDAVETWRSYADGFTSTVSIDNTQRTRGFEDPNGYSACSLTVSVIV
jgi:hypothetical protein